MTARIGLLVNPHAGRGRSARHVEPVVAALAARGDSVVRIGGDCLAAAEESLDRAVGDGLGGLVAMGGDGTVHLALQRVVGTGTTLGIIPTGTGNDIAASLGVPVGDPMAAVRTILDGMLRRVDVGVVRTADGARRHFLCILSTGFDSAVTERANAMRWPVGRARYIRAMLAELRALRPVDYEVTVDGQTRSGLGMMVSVGNAQSYGGGMRLCPQARLDDGRLDVVWLHELGTWQFLRTFPKVFTGRHVEHPAVSQQLGSLIRVAAKGQVAYADGERIGPLPVEIRVQPGAVAVHVPAR